MYSVVHNNDYFTFFFFFNSEKKTEIQLKKKIKADLVGTIQVKI